MHGALQALPRDAAARGELFRPVPAAGRLFLLYPRAGDVCLGLADQGLGRFDPGAGLRGLAGTEGRRRDARQLVALADPVPFIQRRARQPAGRRGRNQVALPYAGPAFLADRHPKGTYLHSGRVDQDRRRHEGADEEGQDGGEDHEGDDVLATYFHDGLSVIPGS